ncbi:MAG TPA: AEC family transporter [Acidimicrobiales bacterium]|nr:AEC family transporter [Acidimicrobiales bacterium]
MLAFVLACFGAGLVLQRLVPTAKRLIGPLDTAVIGVTLPALILAKLPDLELGGDLVVPVGAAWGSGALAVAIVLIASRRFAWSRATTGALMLVTPLGNTTFLGLAMVESLLGKAELTRALAFDQLGSFFGLAVYGSIVAAHWGHGEGGWRVVLGRLVRFPPFLAVVGSFVLRAAPVPQGVDDLLGDIGRLVAPLAMLTVGLRFRLAPAAHSRQAALWCLGIKMAVMPLAVLAAAAAAGGLDDPAWTASVLEAGMPPMVTAGVVAAQADLDGELASTVVGVGLLLALVTIPLFALVVR